MQKIQNDLTFHYIDLKELDFIRRILNKTMVIISKLLLMKRKYKDKSIISYSWIIKDIFNMRHKFCKTEDNMNIRYLYLYFVYFCTLSILRSKAF